MGYADLHIHSTFSADGTCSVQGVLKYVAEKTSLSVIAITDHNEIAGSLLAEKYAPAYGLQVVPSSEISTAEGHLLALFIRQCVPAGMSLLDTLHYVNSLGGICIAAHPKTRFAHSPSRNSIENALRHPIGKKTLVEIEVYNAGLFRKDSNKAAMRIAQENDVSLVADSDAHVARMIGKGATGFEGNFAWQLRKALESHQTHIVHYQEVSSSYSVFSWLYHRVLNRFHNLQKHTTPGFAH
jgi:predicted metal-dependent phosphoesterase TrpH